jgi:hypothetical protein
VAVANVDADPRSWFMDGTRIRSGARLGNVPGPDWEIVSPRPRAVPNP